MSDLKTHAPLQTRFGIATGLVVVGDLFGSVLLEQAIVGETPNLAARLQGVAVASLGHRRKLLDAIAALRQCEWQGALG